MFDWFARQQGMDLSKVSVLNTATPGLVGYAIADRASAVQLWEPAYTVLMSKKPGMRTLDLEIEKRWKPFAGSSNIPYLGVAAHISWIEQHRDLVPKLFAAYKAAAEWIVAHPDETAKLVSPKGTAEDQGAIAALIKANDRLGLNVRWASDMRKEMEAVYAAGKSIGFLSTAPAPTTIYQPK
jgi:ABC-type nitrate/sulfonate/bicarbonate transport system substrate-binding protein